MCPIFIHLIQLYTKEQKRDHEYHNRIDGLNLKKRKTKDKKEPDRNKSNEVNENLENCYFDKTNK